MPTQTPIQSRTAQSPALRSLCDHLRSLFPQAREFCFDFAGTPELDHPSVSDLAGITISFDEGSWEDRPDGLTQPGPAVAPTLTTLGWMPYVADAEPVVDDYALVTIRMPGPGSPSQLTELWNLIEQAFTTTPWQHEPRDDGTIPLR